MAASFGGGIYNNGGSATLTLITCTVSNNHVGLPFGGAMGGGIYNNSGTVEISASTVSGNFAPWYCGGIYNTSAGRCRSRSSVVEDNAVTVRSAFCGIVSAESSTPARRR